MTIVRVRYTPPGGPVPGFIRARPQHDEDNRPLVVGADIISGDTGWIEVPVEGAELDLRPSEPGWHYAIQGQAEGAPSFSVTKLVPATGPVDFGELVDYNPKAGLVYEPDPPWYAHLNSLETGLDGTQADLHAARDLAVASAAGAAGSASTTLAARDLAASARDQAVLAAAGLDQIMGQGLMERPSLVFNGGFDLPAVPGEALPPYLVAGAASTGQRGSLGSTFYLDPAETRRGVGQSLRVEWDFRVMLRVHARPGERVSASVWIKGGADAAGSLSLAFSNASFSAIVSGAFPSVNTNGVWTEVRIHLDVPLDHTGEIFLRLARASNAGTFWIDDVSVQVQGPPAGMTVDTSVGTRVLVAGVMIHGDTGWRDVSSWLSEGVESGSLRVRREGSNVTWRFVNVLLPAGFQGDVVQNIPAGFRMDSSERYGWWTTLQWTNVVGLLQGLSDRILFRGHMRADQPGGFVVGAPDLAESARMLNGVVTSRVRDSDGYPSTLPGLPA